MRKEGLIKFANSDKYQIYELIRGHKGGGGLALGIDKNLQSVWVREGEGEVEAITVVVTLKDVSVRVTNAYSPQEYDNKNKKDKFWEYLYTEVNICNKEGFACLIIFDANSWLGNKILIGDPHEQNENGRLFQNFLENNPNIAMLNNQQFCKGLITRSRNTNNKI